jgi:hypothetical protein
MKKFDKQAWIELKNKEKLTALQFDQHVDYATKAYLADVFLHPKRFQYVGTVSSVKPEWRQLSIEIKEDGQLEELLNHLGMDVSSYPSNVTTPLFQSESGIEIKFKNRLQDGKVINVGDVVELEASMKAYIAYEGKHGLYFEIEKVRTA